MNRMGAAIAAVAAIVAASVIVMPNQRAVASSEIGRWSSVRSWPLIPIHATLTPEGKVLTFGTHADGTAGGELIYDVWDPVADTHNVIGNPTRADLFCAAQFVDPATDRVVTAGGDDGIVGPNGSNPFVTELAPDDSLSELAPMNEPRWYPTSTVLANGDVLVQGGRGNDGGPVRRPELYRSGEGWTSLGFSSDAAYGGDRWWYPRAWVAPDGRVFTISDTAMFYIDPTGDGSIEMAADYLGENGTYANTAVMYRPGRILLVGGAPSLSLPATTDATLIDLRSGAPVVAKTNSMSEARHWATATVLPDGDVLVTGGSGAENQLVDVAYSAELWDPDTGQWSTLASGSQPRLYHSSAMLLPDGRVMVGGGGSPGPLTNLDMEFFSPPYLFDGDEPAIRPTITSAPSDVDYGATITVDVAGDVDRFTMVRAGGVTHSFHFGQRYVDVAASGSGARRSVTMPSSPNDAPPGTWMLFALDSDGTPSVAALINIDPIDVTPPTDTTNPSAPSNLDATIEPNGDVTLTWDPATDNTAVTSYTILRNGTPIATSTTTSHIVPNPTIGSHWYQVRANDAAGNTGNKTPPIRVDITPDDTTNPSAPSNLDATIEPNGDVTLTWDPATDNTAVTSYTILRNGTPIATSTTTSHIVPNPTIGSHWYQVRANDAAGNTGNKTPPIRVDITPDDTTNPSAPSNLDATIEPNGDVTLTWDPATDNTAVTSYIVLRNGTPIAITDRTSHVVPSPAAGSHWYQVRANDAAGNTGNKTPPIRVDI